MDVDIAQMLFLAASLAIMPNTVVAVIEAYRLSQWGRRNGLRLHS